MVSTRSAILLLAVSTALVASTEAKSHKTEVEVKSHLKNPVLKKSTVAHGKYTGVFVDGKKVAHAKYAVEMPSAKTMHKKHHEKKHHAKQVSEKKDGNEHTKTFPHGKVTYVKNEPKSDAKPAHKKSHKKVVKQEPAPTTPEPTEEPVEDDEDAEEEPKNEEGEVDSEESEDVEEKDFKLKVGESVDIEVDGETYTLEHLKNGTTVITYPDHSQKWVDGQDIYLDFEVDEESEAAGSGKQESGSLSGSHHQEADPAVGEEEGLVGEIEKDVKSVAKKFSELATKLTGNGFKEAAPIIFIGGAIGALAAVVGIAAVAIGRARANSADANPESVLADATEDVEADVEAGVTEEKKEDEAADESQALDSSDSESESETEQEEGKFTNEVASV